MPVATVRDVRVEDDVLRRETDFLRQNTVGAGADFHAALIARGLAFLVEGPGAIEALTWMPATCAYRRLHEGRGLPDWHPLLTGDPGTVARAGISVAGQVVSELALAEIEDALDFEAPELVGEPGDP